MNFWQWMAKDDNWLGVIGFGSVFVSLFVLTLSLSVALVISMLKGTCP